jgi:lipoprotein-releasing system ATP-binding protein
MNEVVLRAEKLTRVLTGDVPMTLVDGIDLEVRRGEFVSISGPSGSGKSSLLYLLGLLDRPTGGQLWLDGRNTASFDENQLADIRLARMGFVFQAHFLLPEFSARENVELPMRRLGRLGKAACSERARELLAGLGLKEQAEKRPHQLSGGQSQRVAIARALANQPQVILADEPTGNLDTKASANVQAILRELAHTGDCAVIAVTHDASFAASADRRIRVVDGRLAPPQS